MRQTAQTVANDVAALLRARNSLLWVVTREEARAEQYLVNAAASAGYLCRTWDVAQGIAQIDGKAVPGIRADETKDPGAALDVVRRFADNIGTGGAGSRNVWIMRDLPVWLSGVTGATPTRQLRNLARYLPGVVRETAQAIIVLTTDVNIPPELAGHATVIEWPLPDRDEIAAILDAAVEPYEGKVEKLENGSRAAAIDAAVGLSGEEAQACYARSLVQHLRIDPTVVAQEKKRIITRERVLEWYDPLPGGLDAVGGLENLKRWLITRKSAYSPKARAYGLPAPKGVLLVGVPGCGKSLTAKAVSTAWGVPLLKVDLGALKSKFVGESEANLRKVFKVVEAIGRCVVWFDEIEKALQGATSGSADGGVSSDALGSILSWMQERQGEAFVIATANDVEGLPPELLRKGRFDEIFFVDLPNQQERQAILDATLKANGRSKVKVDQERVALACDGFTGSEIAALVPDAMFAAFNDKGREITTDDLRSAAQSVVPLSRTAAEKIEKLRKWAATRARSATATSVERLIPERKRAARALDI